MKVLLVQPKRHPIEVEIDGSLKSMYEILECETITATYPWEEPVALVTDDNGFFANKVPSRYVTELEQPIMGNFFICGIDEDDFCDLPDELMRKFKEQFWKPELIGFVGGKFTVIPIDDGTKPI